MTTVVLLAPACGHAARKVRRGLCPSCYSRLRTQGGTTPRRRQAAFCPCGRPVHGLGLCSACYQRAHYRRTQALAQALPPEPEQHWAVADVAGALGVSPYLARQWIAAGWLTVAHRGAATGRGRRYYVGDRALHRLLTTHPDLYQDAHGRMLPRVRDAAWVRALLTAPDLRSGRRAA